MIESLLRADLAVTPLNWPRLCLSLTVAFVEGQLVARTYIWTQTGLSYSRSFVGSLVVMPILVCLVMQVLSNNLVTAFGLMGIFAIVRFRNILRDTLDTSYILSAIVLGMAAGTMKFATASVGTLLVCGVFCFLRVSSFGTRHRYDLILNLHWARTAADLPTLSDLLKRYALRTQCASRSLHEGSEGMDLSYRLLLRDRDRTDDLLAELRRTEGVSRVSGLTAEDESEL